MKLRLARNHPSKSGLEGQWTDGRTEMTRLKIVQPRVRVHNKLSTIPRCHFSHLRHDVFIHALKASFYLSQLYFVVLGSRRCLDYLLFILLIYDIRLLFAIDYEITHY